VRRLQVIWRAIAWLVAVFSSLWFGLHVMIGGAIPVVRLINYITPWVSICLLLFFITGLAMRYYLLAGVHLLLALMIASPYLPQFLPHGDSYLQRDAEIYKVMSYSKMGRNTDLESVAAVIRQERPDILFMQEVGKEIFPLLSGLYGEEELFFALNHVGVIVSRFPLTALSVQQYGRNAAELNISGVKVTLWNVHLQKSFVSSRTQMQQIREVLESVVRAPGPVIVAGDFNATPGGDPYILTRKLLHNAYEDAGFGFGFTFPTPVRQIGALMPFIRIDHIFYNDYFSVIDSYVVKQAGGSDHYPIVALMQFSNTVH